MATRTAQAAQWQRAAGDDAVAVAERAALGTTVRVVVWPPGNLDPACAAARRRAVTGPARLRVDFIACDGRGVCAEALPELITLDDWGFPVVSDRDVPPRRLGDARAAVRACPLLALRLDAGTGHRARSASLVPGRPAWYEPVPPVPPGLIRRAARGAEP